MILSARYSSECHQQGEEYIEESSRCFQGVPLGLVQFFLQAGWCSQMAGLMCLVGHARSSSPHSSRRNAVLMIRFEDGRSCGFSHVQPGHGHFCRSRTELEDNNSVLSNPCLPVASR